MTPYRILFAGRARREATRADEWWRANREDAPALFSDELAEALDKIGRAPYSGADVNHPRPLRRWLLSRCRYHLYYSIDDGARTVMLRSLWHATRGHGPRLR